MKKWVTSMLLGSIVVFSSMTALASPSDPSPYNNICDKMANSQAQEVIAELGIKSPIIAICQNNSN